MKQYTKLENIIARAIHQDDLKNKVSFHYENWDYLPYHMKLKYIIDAQKMIRIMKFIRDKYIRTKVKFYHMNDKPIIIKEPKLAGVTQLVE